MRGYLNISVWEAVQDAIQLFHRVPFLCLIPICESKPNYSCISNTLKNRWFVEQTSSRLIKTKPASTSFTWGMWFPIPKQISYYFMSGSTRISWPGPQSASKTLRLLRKHYLYQGLYWLKLSDNYFTTSSGTKKCFQMQICGGKRKLLNGCFPFAICQSELRTQM